MKKTWLALVLGSLLVLGGAGPASAQSSGEQRFIVILSSFNGRETSRVIAVGPITGIGTFEETEDEDVVRFVFPQGTLTLDAPTTDESEDFNEETCSGTFRFSGPWEIADATGAFEGATGSGTFRGQGRFVGQRTDTGCSEDEDAGFFFLSVTVRGNVTLADDAAA